MQGLNFTHRSDSIQIEFESAKFLDAVSKGDLKIIEEYIKSPTFKKIPISYRGSALRFATINNQYGALCMLIGANIDEGIPFNPIGQCFKMATEKDNLEIAALLFNSRPEKITPHIKQLAINAAAHNHESNMKDWLDKQFTQNPEIINSTQDKTYLNLYPKDLIIQTRFDRLEIDQKKLQLHYKNINLRHSC